MAAKRKVALVSFVFAILLLQGSASAQGTIVVPEKWLPGDDAVGPVAGDQVAPAIAQGGDITLAVWSDQRSDPLGILTQEYETADDIYGMRLDASGNPLDALPFPISQAPAAQTNPQVSWNGQNWLVVWEDRGLSGTGFYYSRYIRAARVAPDGTVLDSTPITVSALGSSSTAMFAVASDGVNWAVVSQGTSSGENDMVAVRISPQGDRLDIAPEIILPGAYYLRFDLRLAYAGGVYLLVWEDLNDIQGIRMDQNLQVLDPSPFTIVVDNQGSVQLGSNGSGFFAVWTAAPDFINNVYGSRINSNGSLLDPGGINISQNSSQATITSLPEAGWDGLNWRVTWGFNGLSIARISPGGAILDPGGIAVPVSAAGPVAVAPGGAIQMVWQARGGLLAQSNDIYTVAVSAAFSAGPERTISLGAPSQTHVDLASSGTGWMAVYRSAVSRENRIMAQPLDAGGEPIGLAPVLLDSGDSTSGPSVPKVAWNGSLYLAVWSNQGAGGILGQRIRADGTLVDASPFLIMTGNSPDVDALGDTFLVAGTEQSIGPHFVHPFAIRVRGSDGALLDPAPFQLGQYFARRPVVVELGGRWLVVWQRNASHDNPAASTQGAFVNSDGSFSAEFLIYGYYSTNGGNGIFEIGAAASDNVALVVQSKELTSGVETDLVGVMVNSDGTLRPAFNLTPWQGNQYRPRVAWDGSNFILAYNEQKNRFPPYILDQLDARSDLFGMRIDGAGTIIDSQGFLFSNSSLGETHPNVAAANGVTLMAGSVMRNEFPYAAYRVGYTLFGLGGNAWPVAAAGADVTSGDIPLAVAFNSAGSADPDGSIATYLWDFGDGATSNVANPSHTYNTAGKYVVTLTVTDNLGTTSTNSVAVQATEVNQPPVAVASADITSGPAPLSVVVSASGSYDPDGALGNIHWDFGDGSEYYGSPAYHTYTSEGLYTVTLTVFDGRGGSGTDSLVIDVGPEPPNQPPTAVAWVNVNSGPAPFNPAFSSANSFDPDGFITGWHWDFGDGTASTLPNPAIKVYETPGTYLVTLTVTDDDGATGSDSLTIVVESVPQLVVGNLTVTIVQTGKWKEAEARLRIVDANNTPVSGATVTGDFSGSTSSSVSGLTDGNGEVTFSSPRTRDGSFWQFCVTDVIKDGWAYTPSVPDCGDTGSGPSNLPPAINIIAPADGASVSGSAAIAIDAGDAEDPAGSLTVEWNVDGGAWRPTTYNGTAGRYEATWDTATAGDGVHTLNAQAIDSAGESATDSNAVTVDNGGGGVNGVHVGDLDGASSSQGRTWTAGVTILVENDSHAPLDNATVFVSWNGGSGSCTTGQSGVTGVCDVVVSGMRKNNVTFTVDNIAYGGLNYDPAANHDPDGDSDGTTITVSKP